jgi:membrane protein implicated in regulation of membrane protease activity
MISIIFIIFEILIPSTFYFVCFSIGSLFASIVTCFCVLPFVELITFIIISIISLYFIVPIFKKFVNKSKTISSNVDAVINTKAIVIDKIMPFKIGFVKVLGEIWRATSDVEIKTGEIVEIKTIKGTTLIVEKVEKKDGMNNV